MSQSKAIPLAPDLTNEKLLKTLVENRTIYNLENCELNLFETYQASELVPLKFNDLVVTSMLKGKKVMHLFDKDGFDYLPGESVIVPSNVEMKIDFPEATFNNPTQCLALAIDNKKITDTLQFLNEKYPQQGVTNFWQLNEANFYFENNAEMANLINKIITICQSTSIFKDTLADLSLQELLVKIVQLQTLKGVREKNTKINNPLLNHVVALIRDNIKNKIELKQIARNAGLSTSSLYRLFKNEMGISPVEFVILEKIKLAKQYLSNKDIYIKNVSYEAGFEDSNYFIRLFKHYEGITPKQYQQLLLKNSDSVF
ncbi:MAG: AraC family transcriptional regulator [Cyclobacteriaceae bacterium]|jgi:AraC-like DNA-binding protein|nr:AraC family transcriptional regulator [Flammeovirgaceae bacterium]